MYWFDLRKTEIFKAIKLEKFFKVKAVLKKIFILLFFVFLLLFLYGFVFQNFSQDLNRKLLGFCLISLVFAVFFWLKLLFFNSKLKEPKKKKINLNIACSSPEKYNLAEFLNFEAARIVWRTINSKYKNSSGLLYFLLDKGQFRINFIFSRLFLNLKKIKKELEQYLREFGNSISTDLNEVILEAAKTANNRGKETITENDILIALSNIDSFFEKYLIDFNLKTEDIENIVFCLEYFEKEIEENKKFWKYENLVKIGTLAKNWLSGYTITLDKFSYDLTETIRKQIPEIIGHKQEIEAVERILGRQNINDVLLVGESGTGRKSIITALAKKSFLGQSLPENNYKRVVELDLTQIISNFSQEEIENVLNKIFQETALAGNIILVINEFHNYVGQIPRPGVVDISGILTHFLPLPQFQIIGITTFDGLHRYIEQSSFVLSHFEKVEVSEISFKETLLLLENLSFSLEKKYKVFIPYPSIKRIIFLCERYLSAFAFPEKAINFLEEAVIYSANQKEKILSISSIDKIFKEKTQIPVGELEISEKEILLNLEKLIHKRIINQEEAVKEVSTSLRRARANITIRKGPMGVFLFLGPTGVGKTETSKALAEIYFGNEEKMIRMDMSEFQEITDISRLLGDSKQTGLLTTPVRENPFSLILLDEIEKAHPNILNLFLQVFDEGNLTDGQGRKIDFKNTIIIATSNAGYKIILEAVKQKPEWSNSEDVEEVKKKLLDYLFNQSIFLPEFINRFDAIVVFRPLTKENLLGIAELLLQKLKKNLKEKNIEFVITTELKEKIVELGYNPSFGAREMRRVIQDKIENPIAVSILKDEIKKGDRIEISADFIVIINKI